MKREFNLPDLIRENIKDLQPYSSARDEYISNGAQMIFLDANESPFENGVNRYPDPQQRNLKRILADQRAVAKENMVLGNGSDEVLDLLFRAFCEPKTDNIITMPPTYGMYKVLAAINNIENREVLLTPEFQLDEEEILQKVDSNTKIIFICSPNNPTGNQFSAEKIITLLKNFNGLVVIDEAYIDFTNNQSWVSQLPRFSNLVITQTLSKAYGMAGIRLGICIASQAIISVLNKIKPPYNVNELTQQKAMERVLNADAVAREVAEILKEKEKLLETLGKIPFVYRVFPSDANFVLAEVDDADKRYQQLLAKGIVVRNRSNQPLCKNTLRFTVGLTEENKKLINALNSM
jgi:histidinol-phosphate aminotransferase